jgi:hypothetical protein
MMMIMMKLSCVRLWHVLIFYERKLKKTNILTTCYVLIQEKLETNITRWNHQYEIEKFEFEKHSHIHDSNPTITNNGRLSNETLFFLNFHQKHCSLVY